MCVLYIPSLPDHVRHRFVAVSLFNRWKGEDVKKKRKKLGRNRLTENVGRFISRSVEALNFVPPTRPANFDGCYLSLSLIAFHAIGNCQGGLRDFLSFGGFLRTRNPAIPVLFFFLLTTNEIGAAHFSWLGSRGLPCEAPDCIVRYV